MKRLVAALLSLASACEVAATTPSCPEGESLAVVSVPASFDAAPTPLRANDVLLAWTDAAGIEHAACDLIDLARADLEVGALAPIALHVRRGDEVITAQLLGGRNEIAWRQEGSSDEARASIRLLALRERALAGDFAGAGESLTDIRGLEPAPRAFALELALGWLEADPDRAAGFALADEIVALRKGTSKRANARALVLRGRAWLLRRDLKSAAADAEAADALLDDEPSLVTAQLRLLHGALDYLTSQYDAAEARYREAIALIDRISPDGVAEASALSNLAALEVARGRPAQAFEHYDAALALLSTAAPGSYSEARLLFNRALASTELRRALLARNPS